MDVSIFLRVNNVFTKNMIFQDSEETRYLTSSTFVHLLTCILISFFILLGYSFIYLSYYLFINIFYISFFLLLNYHLNITTIVVTVINIIPITVFDIYFMVGIRLLRQRN